MDLGGLIRKEFGRIKSDKRTLVLLFIVPVILILVFGLTSSVGITKTFTAAIITRDDMPTFDDFSDNSSKYDGKFISIMKHETASWTLYKFFNATDEEGYNSAHQECYKFIQNGNIDIFLILPENFSESVENKINPVLTYYIDASDAEAIKAIEVAIQEPIALFRAQTDMIANFTIMVPYLEFDVPFWESIIMNYAIPLILPIIILGTTMNLTALSIVSEAPLPRMLITPTAKREIIFSKLIANSIVMLLQSTEILITIAFFGLYSLGSLFNFYLVLIMIGFSGICIGLFISSVSPTEQSANQMYLIIFIIIILFSGAILPLNISNPGVEIFLNLLPLTNAVPLITDITLKGLPINLTGLFWLILGSLMYISLAYVIYMFKKLEV